MLNLTKAAANEFAAHGIRVNAVAPGFFLGVSIPMDGGYLTHNI